MVRVKRAIAGPQNPPRRAQLPRPGHARAPGEGSKGGCRIGIAPGYIHKKGHVGVVSRSGTLTYEAVFQLTSKNIGQSTCVGIGGDPVNGTSHLDVIKMFNDDPETHGIILIGEIGGNAEVEAARWIKAHCKKPVAGFIAGATAPAGRRMGHAGAIVGGAEDTAAAKIAVFKECGIEVAVTPSDMADALLRASWRSARPSVVSVIEVFAGSRIRFNAARLVPRLAASSVRASPRCSICRISATAIVCLSRAASASQ
jgi:succinyl-CoA synthetase alpha subunit